MMRWPTKSLEAIAELYGGSTPSRENATFWGGEIPWVTPTDLPMPDEGISVVSKTKECITEAGLDKSAATVLPKGTVLFSSRATIGKVAVTGMPLTTNQGFANFVPHSGLTSRFLAYALWVRREDIARLSGSTTFKEVSRTTLRKYHIPVPPLAEQRRIVKLLDEADELRKLRVQADRRTASLIPALFHEMFGDPIGNREGYPIQQLEEVCSTITDGTHQPPAFAGNGIPFLFVRNIVSGFIDFDTEKFITEETFAELTRRVKPGRGDILYSTVGSYGVAVEVQTDRQFAFQRHIGHLKPNRQRIDSGFLTAQLNTPWLRSQADQSARGIAQKTVNLAEIRKFKVLVPPLPLQKEFARLVTEIRELEAEQASSGRQLEDLFQSLLYRAFRGDL